MDGTLQFWNGMAMDKNNKNTLTFLFFHATLLLALYIFCVSTNNVHFFGYQSVHTYMHTYINIATIIIINVRSSLLPTLFFCQPTRRCWWWWWSWWEKCRSNWGSLCVSFAHSIWNGKSLAEPPAKHPTQQKKNVHTYSRSTHSLTLLLT